MREADQLIAGALHDIAAEAGLARPAAEAAWRAGRRRRLAALATSVAAVAGAIALALTVALPLTAARGPAASSRPPGRLVSFTLSPARPASADVLASAARLLRQRAAHLRLQDTQAQVVGPNVVLTGPAADAAQLRTLAMASVLNVRQVLLYQPYRGTPYGDAGLVNRKTLALFTKLDCAPGNTGAWKDQAGYVTAGDYDNPDTQIVSCDGSGGKYALDVAKVTGTQIGNAVAALSTTSNQWAVTVTLKSAGATAFTRLTTELVTKYYSGAQAGNQDDQWLDTIAFVLDGNIISAPQTAGPVPGGIAQIAGNFTQSRAEELAAQLQSGALPVDFRVVDVSASAPSASSRATAG